MSGNGQCHSQLRTFLQGPAFVVLSWNEGDPSKQGPFEAWAYQGPLDLQTAAPVTFGVGVSIQDSLEALELQIEGPCKQSDSSRPVSQTADGPIRLCVDRRELATTLAALRFHQDENLQDDRKNPDAAIDDIATDSGALLPLDFKEVGELCERLNTGEEARPATGVFIEPPHEELGDKPLFRIVYMIDLNARGATEAAQETHRLMTDPDSIPPVLDVLDHTGQVTRLDLSDEDAREGGETR